MFAATGSTMTTATDSSSVGTTLYGSMRVSATAPAVTPAESGVVSVSIAPSATPEPAEASSASEWPW